MNWVQINIQVNEDFRYMKISHICTAVEICELDWMFICTQFIDQLSVGLLAQLVER